MSLREIAAFLSDYRAGRLDDAELIEYLQRQQDRLRRKAAELSRLALFLDAKIGWIRQGKVGTMPSVANFVPTP